MRNLIFYVILLAGVSRAQTLVGSFTVDYRYNAAGCPDAQPNAYNPYQCPSQIPPGTVFFDNMPAGTYKLVTTGLGPLGSPGAVIWTGNPNSATLSNTGYTWIFANSSSIGATTTFTTTATGSFAFFSHDWYPFDNDPGFSTTFSLYQESACSVSDLTPITDPVALQFENAAPNPPAASLISPQVESVLDIAMQQLQSDIYGKFFVSPQRQSGLRPLAYQTHLYELRTKKQQLLNAIANDPTQQSACTSLSATLDNEINNRHELRLNSAGLPQVNRPMNSSHSQMPSQAIDLDLSGLNILQLSQIDTLAAIRGLQRPCFTHATGNFDSPHFTLTGVACNASTSATAQSPINMLVTDPLGRRIGYDSTEGRSVNETPGPSYFSGPDTEPQLIDIGEPQSGIYTVQAVGTRVGSYTLTLETSDEDGNTLTHQQEMGAASVGSIASISAVMPPSGDVNQDGQVNCSDMTIVKASFGKKRGQEGFDARGDVNGDGIVDIRDLAFVSQKLRIGTSCP